MKRILLSWSSGKDSAWCLHLLRQREEYEIAGLLTTINEAADRVAMHGVRRELLEQQARSAGLPLWTVPLPWPCSNHDYERKLLQVCERAAEEGVAAIAFGDLFLQEIRDYREAQLRGTGLQPLFPLWGLPTDRLARQMLAGGLRATITCVDTRVLPAHFAGREFDAKLLHDLPPGIDRCGERGEFHTFCAAGPMFSEPIAVLQGETVLRDGFCFADLLPARAGLHSWRSKPVC